MWDHILPSPALNALFFGFTRGQRPRSTEDGVMYRASLVYHCPEPAEARSSRYGAGCWTEAHFSTEKF